MPEASPTLLRSGGYAAFTIIPVMIAAGIAFWLFLNGAGAMYGPINDLLVAIALGLLVLPVLAIRSIVAPTVGWWFDVLTWLTLAGLALGAVGQVLLVSRVIPLEGSFVTGSLGILPVLAWVIAVGILAGRIDAVPDPLGWVTLAMVAAIVALAIGSAVLPGFGISVLSAALLVALGAWLVVVGLTCLAAIPKPSIAVSG